MALLVPASAWAKELSHATVCGAEGCRTITDRDELRGLIVGGDETLPPQAPGRFYAVELGTRDDVREYTWTIWYAPGPDAIAVVNEAGNVVWHPTGGTAFQRATRGLAAFPPPHVTSVRIGERVVTDGAATYARLFTERSHGSVGDAAPSDWTPIDLRSARPTPWTASRAEFWFSPEHAMIERGWERVALPESTADAISAARPLTAGEPTRLLPWLVLAALVGGIALLAVLGRLLRAPPAPEAA